MRNILHSALDCGVTGWIDRLILAELRNVSNAASE